MFVIPLLWEMVEENGDGDCLGGKNRRNYTSEQETPPQFIQQSCRFMAVCIREEIEHINV